MLGTKKSSHGAEKGKKCPSSEEKNIRRGKGVIIKGGESLLIPQGRKGRTEARGGVSHDFIKALSEFRNEEKGKNILNKKRRGTLGKNTYRENRKEKISHAESEEEKKKKGLAKENACPEKIAGSGKKEKGGRGNHWRWGDGKEGESSEEEKKVSTLKKKEERMAI